MRPSRGLTGSITLDAKSAPVRESVFAALHIVAVATVNPVGGLLRTKAGWSVLPMRCLSLRPHGCSQGVSYLNPLSTKLFLHALVSSWVKLVII